MRNKYLFFFVFFFVCVFVQETNAQDSTKPKVKVKPATSTSTGGGTQTNPSNKPKTPKVGASTNTQNSQSGQTRTSTQSTQAPRTSQTRGTNSNQQQPGTITLYEASEVKTLVSKHRYINQNETNMDGWRIQLIQATNRDKVLQTRANFSAAYPNIPVYLDYEQPYFKLRAGNFIDQLQAYRYYQMIKQDFSRAFLIQTRIAKSKVF